MNCGVCIRICSKVQRKFLVFSKSSGKFLRTANETLKNIS